MGMRMRMMFTVFLLVVLANTVVSFPSDRDSDGADAEASDEPVEFERDENGCCWNPSCPRPRCTGRR
uniref:Conotoxin Bu1.4 n=1 Tax=Conus bullatus TaxID=89438 RepID=CA120_CONBU|nr:RecName: Full=Conotoxin Bu1.4; AltName: Full=Bu1.3; AltName: Full=Conotoxin Bu20; Flags: Precursor [Conus bullatus]